MTVDEKITLFMAVRRACFIVIDAIEIMLHLTPTTGQIRNEWKTLHKQNNDV
jgi:hypothetical protein